MSCFLMFTNQTLDIIILLVIHMRYDKLNQILTSISYSESQHLKGIKPNYNDILYTLDNNNNKIYHFNFSSQIPDDSIIILRNERFAPVPTHIHDYIEINFMYSGKCIQTIGTNTITLKQGQITLIDTKTPHSIGNTDENDILINFVISKEYFTSVILSQLKNNNLISSFFINAFNDSNSKLNYLVFNTENNERLQLFIKEFLLEYYYPSSNNKQVMNHLFILIILDMMNAIDTSVVYKSISQTNTLMVDCLKYLENHFLTCTLKETAQHLGVNECYLSSLFKRYLNKTYKEIIIQLKMEYAAKLLVNSNLSIEEVAHKTGYHNLTFFYHKFESYFSCLPSVYRNKNKIEL